MISALSSAALSKPAVVARARPAQARSVAAHAAPARKEAAPAQECTKEVSPCSKADGKSKCVHPERPKAQACKDCPRR